MDKQEVIRRLVFIKYLYGLGVEQSTKAEPYSWAAILTFHDAVELFLLLVAEYLDVHEKALRKLTFLDYWDNINPKLKDKNKELTQRITMEKLNEVRVALKHHGTEPSLDAINSAKENSKNFLEENSIRIFDINFSEISLIELVRLEGAKKSLKQAIQLLERGDTESAMDNIAIAFHQLVDDYVDRKRDWFGHSHFDFPSFGGLRRSDRLDNQLDEVRAAFHDLDNGLEQLNETIKIIALGFDYPKYYRFETVTSRQVERSNKSHAFRRLERKTEGDLTVEDTQFCIDFVIECAIILEENDFEFRPKKHQTLSGAF